MVLEPQDVMALLKLAGAAEQPSYHALAGELGMSASEVHQALRRCIAARLAARCRAP